MDTLQNILNQPNAHWLFYDDDSALRDETYMISDALFERQYTAIKHDYLFNGLRSHGLSLSQKYAIFNDILSISNSSHDTLVLEKHHPDYDLWHDYCIKNNQQEALFFMGEFQSIKISRTMALNILKSVRLNHFIHKNHFNHLHTLNIKKDQPIRDACMYLNQALRADFWLHLLEHLSLLDEPSYQDTSLFLIKTTQNLHVLCRRDKSFIQLLSEDELMKMIGNHYLRYKTIVNDIEKIPLSIRTLAFYRMWDSELLLYVKIQILANMFPELMSRIYLDTESINMKDDIEKQFNTLVWNLDNTRASYIATLNMVGSTDIYNDATFVASCMSKNHCDDETNLFL